MNIEQIMALSPYLEVLIRQIYWRIPTLVQLLNARKKTQRTNPAPLAQTSIHKVIDFLADHYPGKEAPLILHSKYKALRADGSSPDTIIDALLDFIGKNGTLAMPAIPNFPENPPVHERITADVANLIVHYDPATAPAWTGVLPTLLLQRPTAIRSLHPLNTMVAIGPLAEPMMRHNLSGEKPLPCGIHSCWYFCYEKNAIELAVGADLAHSLTMIHVAEDMRPDTWPVPNWYRDRKFMIKDGSHYNLHILRERHPRWASHYAERTLSKDLLQEKIIIKTKIDGVNVELLQTKKLVDYLNRRNHTGYPYYLVPLK